jgi:Carboxypeptidase regulatory-like domain
VCFLGECRGSSSQLSVVLAEVRAPVDQQLGVTQRAGIDLRQSALVDFQMQPLLSASGTVLQEVDGQPGATTPVPDAGVVLTDATPAISDRAANVVAQTGAAGVFALTFSASTWTVLVIPPAPAPPIRPPPPASPLSSTVTGLAIVLPAPGQLAHVGGSLLVSGSPLAGALVTAVDGSGQPLSAVARTDANGNFGLQLPPGPPVYFLNVGPDPKAAATDPAVPAFPLHGPFTASALGVVDLGALPASATLAGKVVDSRQQLVAGARVLALSLDPTGWVISRQTTTDPSGAFTMTVRAGTYAVEAAPDADPALPGVSDEILATLPAAPLTIACPDKSQGTGVVIRPDGQRVGAGYEITALRLADRLVAARAMHATSTDAAGSFSIVGDRGRYRVDVIPPAASGLPRKIVSVELGIAGQITQLPTLRLPSAFTVVGTIGSVAGQSPVVGATVDFFALDASGSHSVLIGSGLSDAQGRYRAVLPDVPTPTDQPP